MAIHLPGSTTTLKNRRFAIHSDPKHGKTRLITSLPWNTWGDTAAYIAWDPGSETLDSVLEHNRAHLIRVVPEPEKRGNKLVFDPHKEAIKWATKPWADGFEHTLADGTKVAIPPVQTIIWDTMTATARDLLSAYADSGVFSGGSGDKHVSAGDPGTASYMANPMQGDYGMAQRAIHHIIGYLFKQRCNVIVAFHTDFLEPEGAGQVTFGPATVGKAAIKSVASLFDNLLFITTRDGVDKTKQPPTRRTQYILNTEKKGLYLGGMRTPHEQNPLPEVILNPDPVNAWIAIDNTQGAK